MLEIRNKTPFQTAIVPYMDKEGYDFAAIVIKGSFDIGKGSVLLVSDLQSPLVWGDEFYGEPGTSSVKYESDVCPVKKGTDLVMRGYAYAPRDGATVVDVNLQVGSVSKAVRVYGTRKWVKSLGAWRWTDPATFDRIPLMYEKAFGGGDMSDPAKPDYEKRNPVGTGFSVSKKNLEGRLLPNFEDPKELIRSWTDKPAPAGFGFIGRSWAPRVKYAGVYDDRWQKERFPMLPFDFDELFFNGASPDLVAQPHLKGGEPVKVLNTSREGTLQFTLPKRYFDISVRIKGKENPLVPILDTVIIELEEKRVLLTWRVAFPCFRKFLYIDCVKIKEKG
jgi:hypothetical protein